MTSAVHRAFVLFLLIAAGCSMRGPGIDERFDRIASLTNADVGYTFGMFGANPYLPPDVEAFFWNGTISEEFKAQLIHHFEARLHDRDVWIVSHVILSYVTGHRQLGVPDRVGVSYFNGLRIRHVRGEPTVDAEQRHEISQRWASYLRANHVR